MIPVHNGLRLRRLAAALALICLPGGAVRAEDGVPALLQFAEQYRSSQQSAASADQPAAAQSNAPAASDKGWRSALKQREEQLGQLKGALHEQDKQLAALRQALAVAEKNARPESTPGVKPADFVPLRQWVSQLSTAVRGTPDAQRSAELITQARQQMAHSQQALAASQQQLGALKMRLDDMKTQLQQNSAREQQALAREAEQDRQVLQLQDDIKGLRERAKWLVKPEELAKPERRQAYAAGSALGRDIIEMLTERQMWGITADRQTVLAGVIDAFSGQYQLTTDVLSRALTESETAVDRARSAFGETQRQKNDAFINAFKKEKGVIQAPSGFWYRVDYAGDAALADDAVVDVVVRESLTDGTVIQDMDLTGKVLSQPLTDFPPLFREAIGLLKNHGSLTMVVPPALAYGEAGYPPKVPANATMVYELRIDNSRPADKR
ncbi:FKBP-type peptidyl-prolyl cis-trans isomerase fkpA precursor [Serratia entomophila]|uniref:FKBP-type peptidyl-prolyl cis-trans isomerase N-terminal domain-containing protein n=1 Tax=Serratia entomophila TaxID=42906 RepID=UPI0021792CEB|nr:FKBP-type peptidyl-prolyl cis-trans isomerase N-terminal domain-containing protein [Serratia entomophila]CAI1735708.1 FKBP-type peptidyl-prolyl cis-trans isomerase fkpA precursor [Serratia entomophila]CAI2925593.1 FKBP-type peptidyl-prolyl cis-trans isomerase fkpA precursor [Serratia entomophila]